MLSAAWLRIVCLIAPAQSLSCYSSICANPPRLRLFVAQQKKSFGWAVPEQVADCRRDGKAITLSHDALLVALVSTAPHVKQAADDKLKPISVELALAPDDTVKLTVSPDKPALSATGKQASNKAMQEADSASVNNAVRQDMEESQEDAEDADANASKHGSAEGVCGDTDTQSASQGDAAATAQADSNTATGTQPSKAATAAADKKQAGPYAPGAGKRSDLTFLDPMNKADCPPKAIALAAGELVLRIREEKRRRKAGGLDGRTSMLSVRMSGNSPGGTRLSPCSGVPFRLLGFLQDLLVNTWCSFHVLF